MHARRFVVVVSVVSFPLGIASLARAAEKFEIDPAHSSVTFKVNHMGVSTVYGRFNLTKPVGAFVLDADDPAKSTFEIQVPTKNIDTGVQKRDDHLRSPDFFNAAQFPTISFKSTSVKKVDDKTMEVTGDL